MSETVVNTMTSLERQINKYEEKLNLLSLNILMSLQTKFGLNNNIYINNNNLSRTKIKATTTTTRTKTQQHKK
jgi:uncharacterized protein (DUF342 family)